MWHVCFSRAPREVRLAKTRQVTHHMSHITVLGAKRTQEPDPHSIAKGSGVKKQATTAEVKVTVFLAEHNLTLAIGPLSKSIFPDSNIAKEHSYAK